MDVLDELERRFAAAIEAEQDQQRTAPPQRRRRRVHRRLQGMSLATGGAVAALAVVGAVVLTIALGGGGRDADERTPAPSLLLERIAQAAEQAPAPPVLRDGQLWYVRGEGVDQPSLLGRAMAGTGGLGFEPIGLRRRFSIEQWSGRDAEGRLRRLTLAVTPMFERDRPRWEALPRSRRALPPDRDVVYTDVRELPLRNGLFTPQELRDLPTDPAALLRTVEAAVRGRALGNALYEQSPDAHESDAIAAATFEAIRELLLLPVTPRQRAALLRAFAQLPGTRVPRIDTDARGRRGAVLVFTPRATPRVPRVLVVAVEDGRLLAERGPRNSVETTWVTQGVAPDVRSLPKGVAPPKERLPEPRQAPRYERTAEEEMHYGVP